MLPKYILAALAVLVATAGLVVASAAAEPKNQWPFTRPVSSRVMGETVTAVGAAAVPIGEPKNEPPFTSKVSADPGLAVALHELSTYYAGPKSSAMIRPIARNVTRVGSRTDFHGAVPVLLGAVALALGAIGTAALRRRSSGVA